MRIWVFGHIGEIGEKPEADDTWCIVKIIFRHVVVRSAFVPRGDKRANANIRVDQICPFDLEI